METKIRTELEKSIMSNDMLGFREELVKKLGQKIMLLSTEDLWPMFQKAAGNSGIDWHSIKEPVYDDGIDYSSRTRRFKSRLVDHFVKEIIEFILRRRNSLRFDFKKTIDVYPTRLMGYQPLIARSKNISASGMLIRSGTPFRTGEKLELKVHTKPSVEPVRIFGSVVRTEKRRHSVFDIGVFINAISRNDEEHLYTTAEAVYRLSQMGA